jgi:hypothetical protein
MPFYTAMVIHWIDFFPARQVVQRGSSSLPIITHASCGFDTAKMVTVQLMSQYHPTYLSVRIQTSDERHSGLILFTHIRKVGA